MDRWIIIVEQNVRLQGSMHPVKFLSRGRGRGLWWPAGLLLEQVEIYLPAQFYYQF